MLNRWIRKRVLATVSAAEQAEVRQLLTGRQIRYAMEVKSRNRHGAGDIYEYSIFVAPRDFSRAVQLLNSRAKGADDAGREG